MTLRTRAVMNGAPIVFQAEIDRLHWLITIIVRAGGSGIDDLRRHLPLLAALPREGVHLAEFLSSRSHCPAGYLGHGPPLFPQSDGVAAHGTPDKEHRRIRERSKGAVVDIPKTLQQDAA